MAAGAKQDRQSVTPEGKSIRRMIDGVRVRPATTHPDDRGSVCEMFNHACDLHPDPLDYVYHVMIRPGKVKGWVVHREQDDRIFVSQGTVRFALYDDRAESPTYKLVNEIFVSDQNRGLIIIPKGVYHAVQNVGNSDAIFINMPTKAYNHANPDKYRLPLDNDIIPYRFVNDMGC